MKAQAGFTLTEVLVVVAIVAILLSIGVPSYKYITTSYRMSAEINSLVGDLMYARAEAIREGQPVAICVSTDGQTCSAVATWNTGWIVFSNPANDGVTVAGGVLHVQGAFTGTTPDTFALTNPISSIIFNREGFAVANGGAGFVANQFTLHEKTSNAAYTRCLLISAQGMVQTETGQNHPYSACN
jgi:type IV fimbrial biogenesis protein FimT